MDESFESGIEPVDPYNWDVKYLVVFVVTVNRGGRLSQSNSHPSTTVEWPRYDACSTCLWGPYA